MMSASKSPPKTKKTKTLGFGSAFDPRNGLKAYLDDPTNPRVLGYNDDFVVIKDMYPKATVHLLILPRDSIKQHQNPSQALNDIDFLSKLKNEASKWRSLAAKELARTLCPPNTPIPEKDWEAEIKVGIHSVPSMNHLHIHVLSRDLHSPCLQHKKHYNSFTTSFFVGLDEFPLSEEEAVARKSNWHTRHMICWRCNRNFENKFASLKRHLENEFEEWKAELIKPEKG
jgi:aprataxin